MEASVFFRVVHSVSDIDNLRSDDTSMLYHRSCYKTYTSRRNCGFFKVESAGSDHKPDTSQVPLLNKQTDDTSTDIALCIFCGKQIFKKERKLNKIKTAERLQNVKDAAEGQNDYKMSGLLSNATFIDKAVYHSGCITKYLLTRTPGKSEPYNSEFRRFDNEHYMAFQSLVSDIHEDLFVRKRAFTMTQLHHR